MAQLERRPTELETQLQDGSDEESVVALHPAAPARYRCLVERLTQVLAQPEKLELAESNEAFRALIRSVVVKPLSERSAFDITVETELAPLLAGASLTTLGAGTGFEPVTFRL